MIVRVSEDAQAKLVVTSLLEPSLKVAMAFNWVVLPMATVACSGATATEVNSAAAPAPLALALVSVCCDGVGRGHRRADLRAGCLTTDPARGEKLALTIALGT